MAPHLSRTILVIDDEPSIVRALSGLLRRDGYVVGTARNGRYALAQLQAQPYDVIVCDLRRPELDGPAFYGVPAASVQKMPRSLPAGEVKAFRGLLRRNTVRKVARIPRR